MLESVQKYFDAKEAAEAEHTKAIGVADTEYNATDRSGPNRRMRAQRHSVAGTRRELAFAQAWLDLLDADDPLVRYIAANFDGYKSYADIVLRELPANLSRLRQIRHEQGWCGDYSSYLNEAVRLGLIEDDMTPQRRALDDWVVRNVGSGYTEQATQLVDAIIESEAIPALDVAAVQQEQLARVDEAWGHIREVAPEMINRDAAEHLFRQAARTIILGDGALFADAVADPEPVEAE
jgi:hypothetical protein